MMKALIWRDIRGFVKTPPFFLAILCMLFRIAKPQEVNPHFINFAIYITVTFYLLGDYKTGEVEWLFLLPVRKIFVHSAKYLTGLVITGTFLFVISIATAITFSVPSWHTLMTLPLVFVVGYSAVFALSVFLIWLS